MSGMIASVMGNHSEIFISHFLLELTLGGSRGSTGCGGGGEEEHMEKKRMRSRANSEHPLPLRRS